MTDSDYVPVSNHIPNPNHNNVLNSNHEKKTLLKVQAKLKGNFSVLLANFFTHTFLKTKIQFVFNEIPLLTFVKAKATINSNFCHVQINASYSSTSCVSRHNIHHQEVDDQITVYF